MDKDPWCSGKHSPECLQANADFEAARAMYAETWPNYCRQCGGWGGVVVRGDWVPYGMSGAFLPDQDEPCSECQEDGRCPRCGVEMDVEHEDSACPGCGWKWGDEGGPTDGPGCLCPMPDLFED